MSTESELELRIAALDPHQFERLVYDLVLVEHPNAIRPRVPDGGADVLVPAWRDERALVWQAKHHTSRIAWGKCEASLAVALDRYDPENVTFVFPTDLTQKDLEVFASRLGDRPVRVELWTLSTLRARLQASPHVYNTYFPETRALVDSREALPHHTPVVTEEQADLPHHVFISYVHEDRPDVQRLAEQLEAAGVKVWLDRDQLTPGERWPTAIRSAIEEGAFFLACFSKHSAARRRSYMNEELVIAIEELRKRPSDRAWFLPVLFHPGTVPKRDIGAGETLHAIHQVPLYEDWDDGVRRLLTVISPDADNQAARGTRQTRFKGLVADAYRKGDFFETFFAVELNTTPFWLTRDQIRDYIRLGTVVPSRYLYSTDKGASSWIKLCADPLYTYHTDTLQFWRGPAGKEIAGLIRAELGSDELDYVSLGCGDGNKDASLVRHWLASEVDVLYYPYDASLPLLSRAAAQVLRQLPPSLQHRLRTKAVLADFSQLGTIGDIFRQRSSPKIVALLGNSLASLGNEMELLLKIKEAMSPEDLLLLEVRLKSGDHEELELTTSPEVPFYLDGLRALGALLDEKKMSVRVEHNLSAIQNTATCVVGCKGIQIESYTYHDVSLAHIHSYTADAFRYALATIGFEVIESRIGSRNTFLTCVVRLQTVTPLVRDNESSSVLPTHQGSA
jgi:TIR domain/Histidine-specific methyltransferase, SAM-dependent